MAQSHRKQNQELLENPSKVILNIFHPEKIPKIPNLIQIYLLPTEIIPLARRTNKKSEKIPKRACLTNKAQNLPPAGVELLVQRADGDEPDAARAEAHLVAPEREAALQEPEARAQGPQHRHTRAPQRPLRRTLGEQSRAQLATRVPGRSILRAGWQVACSLIRRAALVTEC